MLGWRAARWQSQVLGIHCGRGLSDDRLLNKSAIEISGEHEDKLTS